MVVQDVVQVELNLRVFAERGDGGDAEQQEGAGRLAHHAPRLLLAELPLARLDQLLLLRRARQVAQVAGPLPRRDTL